MCQIVSKYYKNQDDALRASLSGNIASTIDTLNVKGSDEYSLFVVGEMAEHEPLIIRSKDEETFIQDVSILKDFINIHHPDEGITMVWFSRQIPEEEANNVLIPPYWNKGMAQYYWVHGTISNDKEVLNNIRELNNRSKKFPNGIDISVDTELFKYINESEIDNLEGLFTYFVFDMDYPTDGIKAYDKGMGLWEKEVNEVQVKQCSNFDNEKNQVITSSTRKRIDTVNIAFSAGMDISMSAYYILAKLESRSNRSLDNKDIGKQKVILTYFDYGTNASKVEIEACQRLLGFYIGKFPELSIELRVVEASDMIKGFSNISGDYLKIADKDAVGDARETEENISYVPYRNTLFCMALNATMQKEGKRGDNNIIVLGLNLSEGMVFGDNNSKWVECTEQMLNAGGKFYQNTQIISPYMNRTKTNTLKDFKNEFRESTLEKLLELSFSCYYPINGEKCGKCGSCILRDTAEKKLDL